MEDEVCVKTSTALRAGGHSQPGQQCHRQVRAALGPSDAALGSVLWTANSAWQMLSRNRITTRWVKLKWSPKSNQTGSIFPKLQILKSLFSQRNVNLGAITEFWLEFITIKGECRPLLLWPFLKTPRNTRVFSNTWAALLGVQAAHFTHSISNTLRSWRWRNSWQFQGDDSSSRCLWWPSTINSPKTIKQKASPERDLLPVAYREKKKKKTNTTTKTQIHSTFSKGIVSWSDAGYFEPFQSTLD